MMHRRRSLEKAVLPLFESLEDRQHLSVTKPTLSGSVLTVTGSDAGEKITIGGKDKSKLLISIGSSSFTFSRKSVKTINVDGGLGDDRISVSDSKGTVEAKINLVGGDGDDTINLGKKGGKADGGIGNDSINGGDGSDNLVGGDGNDFIQGKSGNDTLHGSLGDDQIYGDAGNDKLFGDEGNDTLGGDDEDTLYFSNKKAPKNVSGNDKLDGGAGDDTLLGGTKYSIVNLLFQSDNKLHKTLRMTADSDHDSLTGGDGADILFGYPGSDNVTDRNPSEGDVQPPRDIDVSPDGVHQQSPTHTHAFLNISIGSKDAFVPDHIGFFPADLSALHTHDDSGQIHFEAAQAGQSYQLMEFFHNWGFTFDANHIGRYRAGHGSTLAMEVVDSSDDIRIENDFQNYEPEDLDQIFILWKS